MTILPKKKLKQRSGSRGAPARLYAPYKSITTAEMRASLLLFTVYHSAVCYLQPRSPRRPLSRPALRALSPLETAIASNDVDAVVDALEDDASVPIDRSLAVAALDKAAAVTPDSSDGEQFAAAFEEARLVRAYQALRRRGLAPSFGVAIDEPFPLSQGASEEQIAREAGDLTLAAFRPKDGAGRMFAILGAVVCGAEIAAAKALGLDSPQPLFLATAGLAAFDTIALKGALAESITSAVDSSYADRIVRHEAGHLLLAYLCGLPVQGCVLSAREALAGEGSGAAALNGAAGTAFFDPELNAAARRGRITRSVIDRYCIVVMGGIAAEAVSYGSAEGGKDDETALISFLQDTVGFTGDVLVQARMSALNGVILLRRHRAEFERLVKVLERDRATSIGAAVLSIDDVAATA